MTAKKDCTKTICPLCERKCQAGSTNSSFIENNGACLQCLLGKTKEQIKALLLAKKTNDDIKNAELLGIDLAKQPNDKGVMVIVSIDKENCIENIDVVELNSAEIDNSCNCAACLHRKNTDEMKIKSPAIFEGYEVSKTFIRNENAYICDGGYAEEVTIKRTWQKPDGSAWVTFLSNMRMGFLDMQLADFAKKYKAKPVEAAEPTKAANWTTPMPAPKPISEKDAAVSKSKRYFEGAKSDKVIGDTRASDGKRYFYITFSCNGGGKKGAKRGYVCINTFNNEIFSIERLSKKIKEILSFKGKRVKDILITDWKEVNKNDYKQLTDDENETPCKLL